MGISPRTSPPNLCYTDLYGKCFKAFGFASWLCSSLNMHSSVSPAVPACKFLFGQPILMLSTSLHSAMGETLVLLAEEPWTKKLLNLAKKRCKVGNIA